MMYGTEKSDLPILPEKRANKAGKPAVTRNRGEKLTALLHHVSVDCMWCSYFHLSKESRSERKNNLILFLPFNRCTVVHFVPKRMYNFTEIVIQSICASSLTRVPLSFVSFSGRKCSSNKPNGLIVVHDKGRNEIISLKIRNIVIIS